jgi:hypothetical protein
VPAPPHPLGHALGMPSKPTTSATVAKDGGSRTGQTEAESKPLLRRSCPPSQTILAHRNC